MLTVIAINPNTVTVSVTHPNFRQDLERLITDIPPQQRAFKGRKWTVTGADKLAIKYVQQALSELERQTVMF